MGAEADNNRGVSILAQNESAQAIVQEDVHQNGDIPSVNNHNADSK